jgi:hypothetical protein
MGTANPDSSSNLELLLKLRVDQAARWLEIHPFEVIRTLVHADALPADLRLDTQHVECVRVEAGLEVWWDGVTVPESEPELLHKLLQTLCERLTTPEGAITRCDNLFRGLDRPRRYFLRRAVNELVRMGYLDVVMTTRGLSVTLPADRSAALKQLTAEPQLLAAFVAVIPASEITG